MGIELSESYKERQRKRGQEIMATLSPQAQDIARLIGEDMKRNQYPALKTAREMVVKEDTVIKGFVERYIERGKKDAE